MAKSKLTPEQKAQFKDAFKECITQTVTENIRWAFCRQTGITIIYKEMPKDNFVKVSVAYCSEKDVFKEKIGLVVALDRWNNGESIQIPIIGFKNDVNISIKLFADLITCGKGHELEMG